MNTEDLIKLLEETEDKLSIFVSEETFNKYEISIVELLDLISEFLKDEEILKLFNYSYFLELDGWTKSDIIGFISKENVLLQIINNDNIMKGIDKYQIIDIIKRLSDAEKQKILYNQNFIEKYQIVDSDFEDIISSLIEEAKIEVLRNIDLTTNKLHLANYNLVGLVENLSSNEAKYELLEIYKFEDYQITNILNTMDIKSISKFVGDNKKFIDLLDNKTQKEVIEDLVNSNLPIKDKREILASLKVEVKQSLDTTDYPEEFKTALNMKKVSNVSRNIILDLEKDPEEYYGLDNLISINPEEYTEEQRKKFIKICEICSNLQVENTVDDTKYLSTAREYKEAEEWIDSIINNLKPEYTKAQKLAVIDNAIGKKISYSPDFDTEVYNPRESRSLWKIISSGYGVCNGIAKVEQYILKRVGIESEIIGSGPHAFLKIKDIELPLANGEIVKGNTIVDPTWNLTSNRFGGKPNNFCICYEQARKNDVDRNGVDSECHKNDEKLQDAILNLDEKSLRQLYTSVGLADRNGEFPLKELKEKSVLLDKYYANEPEQNINKQFLLLSKVCPEFATCQNSSMSIISGILLYNKNLKFEKCCVNRVYDKADKEKRPVLYVYIASKELGKKFYYANKENGKFVELPQEEFLEKFECYDKDLELHKRT